jgi:uncharacterized membrane protein YccC
VQRSVHGRLFEREIGFSGPYGRWSLDASKVENGGSTMGIIGSAGGRWTFRSRANPLAGAILARAKTLPGWHAWLFSFRCFLGAMFALYIAFSIGLQHPYWAMVTVYIVSQPFSGATRSKAIYRLIGTLLGASATVVLLPNLANAPELLSLALAFWVGACLYLSLLDRTPRSYVFMLAGYTAAIIGFPAVMAPDQTFDTAVARVLEIGIGIICGTVVHSIVLPTSIRPVATARIAESMRLVERWADGALDGNLDAAELHEISRRVAAAANELEIWNTFLAWDPAQPVSIDQALGQFRWRLLYVLLVIMSIRDRVHALRLAGSLTPELDDLLSAARAWLREEDIDFASTGAVLRQRIASMETTLHAGAGWTEILTASLLLRVRDLTQLRQDGRLIERHLREPGRSQPETMYVSDAQVSSVRLADHGMAAWSGLATGLAVLICCAFWILGSWADGAFAALYLAIACSLFASHDDPAPMISAVAKWTVVGLVMDAVLLFGVLAMAHDFPTLVLGLAPPFLLCGLLMAMPSTSFAGSMIMAIAAPLLSLEGSYAANFITFVNSGIASVIGMASGAMIFAITRSVSAEWSMRRLLGHAWSELEEAARGRGKQDRGVFAGRMLDRLSLLIPRLAAADPDNKAALARLISDLRGGLNIVDLRRARDEQPELAVGAIDATLGDLATYLHQRAIGQPADPALLLTAIDAALEQVATSPDNNGRRDALLGLVGLRCNLCPDAAPYRPRSLPRRTGLELSTCLVS